ncbi:MAG TPA: hypothetical protein VJ546_06965 [Bacillales bacterium]|nr:hypothetical protein [Bacillales bacterium]
MCKQSQTETKSEQIEFQRSVIRDEYVLKNIQPKEERVISPKHKLHRFFEKGKR